MIDDLRAMAIFAETIRQGSFRGAAKELNLSPSVVSYHITQLEQHLGTALMYRSTRKLSMTHQGEVLYQHAEEMLSAAKKGLGSVQTDDGELSGKLRITLPSALTPSSITRKIADFSAKHPGVDLHLQFTDESQDLIAGRIDLAIRASALADSAMKSKRIGMVERKLVCAPSYWDQHKTPKHPRELQSWNWIKLDMLQNQRTLRQDNKPPVTITYTSNICVNSVEAMTTFCRHGVGLATSPDFMVKSDLSSGTLREVFPDWRVDPIPLYALWLPNATEDRTVRGLLDYLSESE
jgi:DNA-binding transcriptional LysR family regulator